MTVTVSALQKGELQRAFVTGKPSLAGGQNAPPFREAVTIFEDAVTTFESVLFRDKVSKLLTRGQELCQSEAVCKKTQKDRR